MEEEKKQKPSLMIPQSMTVRGALIGASITAFISWNTGKFNRIGIFIRRMIFTRQFIMAKPASSSPSLTNYYRPPLATAGSNFYCYSGQPGVGKSHHFQSIIAEESVRRPALYVYFKSTGREANFQTDLAEQLNYSQHATGMVSQIIRAVKFIHQLHTRPLPLTVYYIVLHIVLLSSHGLFYAMALSSSATFWCISCLGVMQSYLVYFIIPFLQQYRRKSVPVIVFDDVNKIEHLGMLPQIVRFLKLVDDKAVNIILVSSDEETWSKLRREPGMKDRLRLRQIRYDHIETANRITQQVESNFQRVKVEFGVHPLINKEICRILIKQLVGVRQMNLRRLQSVIKLTDQEQYDRLSETLTKPDSSSLQIGEFVKVLLQSQTENIVSNLKTIKRELWAMPEAEFLQQLQLLIKKRKLPSDSRVGSYLKVYNIVRDLRSEYIINGKFTYIIYQLAVQEYIEDLKDFQNNS